MSANKSVTVNEICHLKFYRKKRQWKLADDIKKEANKRPKKLAATANRQAYGDGDLPSPHTQGPVSGRGRGILSRPRLLSGDDDFVLPSLRTQSLGRGRGRPYVTPLSQPHGVGLPGNWLSSCQSADDGAGPSGVTSSVLKPPNHTDSDDDDFVLPSLRTQSLGRGLGRPYVTPLSQPHGVGLPGNWLSSCQSADDGAGPSGVTSSVLKPPNHTDSVAAAQSPMSKTLDTSLISMGPVSTLVVTHLGPDTPLEGAAQLMAEMAAGPHSTPIPTDEEEAAQATMGLGGFQASCWSCNWSCVGEPCSDRTRLSDTYADWSDVDGSIGDWSHSGRSRITGSRLSDSRGESTSSSSVDEPRGYSSRHGEPRGDMSHDSMSSGTWSDFGESRALRWQVIEANDDRSSLGWGRTLRRQVIKSRDDRSRVGNCLDFGSPISPATGSQGGLPDSPSRSASCSQWQGHGLRKRRHSTPRFQPTPRYLPAQCPGRQPLHTGAPSAGAWRVRSPFNNVMLRPAIFSPQTPQRAPPVRHTK